jgi:PTS system mannose-specific IIA component
MIGLVIVTHGKLAEAFRDAMEHVVGKQKNLATVCIESDAEFASQRAEIATRIDEVDDGDGIILLTDMFGGTPSNLAMSMLNQPGVNQPGVNQPGANEHAIEIIGGVNLPMLLKLAKVRGSQSVADAVLCAEAAGRKYICSGHDLHHPVLPPACRAAE